jgi:hypothetical protein
MQPTAQIWILATNRSEAARRRPTRHRIFLAEDLSEAARDRLAAIRET